MRASLRAMCNQMFGHESCNFKPARILETFMKFATPLLAALSFAVLGSAYADTRNSDKGATTMEQKASPANPVQSRSPRPLASAARRWSCSKPASGIGTRLAAAVWSTSRTSFRPSDSLNRAGR